MTEEEIVFSTADLSVCDCHHYGVASTSDRRIIMNQNFIRFCPLHAAAKLMLDTLQEVEWPVYKHLDWPQCFICGGRANFGHTDDCKLNAALKAARGEA